MASYTRPALRCPVLQADLARLSSPPPPLDPSDTLACAGAPLDRGLTPACERVLLATGGRASAVQWARFYAVHAALLLAGCVLAAVLACGPAALAVHFLWGASCRSRRLGCIGGGSAPLLGAGRLVHVVAAVTVAAYAFAVSTLRSIE